MTGKMTHDARAMAEYRPDPSVLVFADSEQATDRARLWAERAGCRVSDAVSLEGAVERLDRQVAADAVLIEIDRDHGPVLDRLLERVEADAKGGKYRGVIVTPFELVDIVSARITHPDIVHLCAPDGTDRLAEIAIACARTPARLHDVRKDQVPPRLRQLSEQMGRMANILATISEEELLAPAAQIDDGAEGDIDAVALRAMIRARRLRDQYFKGELFADPAWDMLLDLMAARLDGQRVAVSSLCIAAAVPATTALRWIKTLTEHGIFVRTADPHDGRRVFIELSDKAAGQLGAYLRAVQRMSPLVI